MIARPPVSLISAQCNKTCLASWCTGQNSSMHAWLKICPGHVFFFSCFSALRLFHDTRLLSSSRKRKEKHVLLHAPDLCTAGCICCCAMHQSTYSHSDQGFFNSISLPMFPDFFESRLERESRTWFLDCVKCKIAANAVHRFFFVQAFPSNAMGKQTLVCKSGEKVSTENHAASKMRKENTQQDDLSRNVSNNNYRKLYSLFSLIFHMR